MLTPSKLFRLFVMFMLSLLTILVAGFFKKNQCVLIQVYKQINFSHSLDSSIFLCKPHIAMPGVYTWVQIGRQRRNTCTYMLQIISNCTETKYIL